MKVLTMTIKKYWFDKIKLGEKTVEYREDKPYWRSRFSKRPTHIKFKNGYSKKSPTLLAEIVKTEVVHGLNTDLKVNKPVIAISLVNVEVLI